MPTAQEIYDRQLLQDDPFDYNKAMDEYKGGRKPLLDAIMSNYKKPEKQINPEQEKKAKYGAALSDTFGSLAQMFAHGQGARVQRKQGASSTEKTNARLQAIRDKYEQDLTQYQSIKGNAAVQDLNMHLANAKEASGKKRQYMLYKAKQAAEEADREAKAAIDKRDFDYKVQQDNKSNELKERELAIQAQRASKDKPDKFEGIVINANEADGKAAVDATGKKVIPYKMTKPEIANIANTAKRDVAFIKENPNVYIDTVDRMGKAVRGLTSDENLAQMYAQWQYDKRYKKPHVAPEVKQFMPWLPKVEQQKTATQPAATKPTQSNFSLNGVKSR